MMTKNFLLAMCRGDTDSSKYTTSWLNQFLKSAKIFLYISFKKNFSVKYEKAVKRYTYYY